MIVQPVAWLSYSVLEHHGIVAIQKNDGSLIQSWDARMIGGAVTTIAPTDELIYITTRYLGAFDRFDGTVHSLTDTINADNQVHTLMRDGETLFIGGRFSRPETFILSK